MWKRKLDSLDVVRKIDSYEKEYEEFHLIFALSTALQLCMIYWIGLLFISEGQFGSYMSVGIQNDGPVTITLDTASSSPSPVSKYLYCL